MPLGEQVFQMNCAVCHGVADGSKPMTSLFPLSTHSQSDNAFIAFLRTKKTFAMPAFSATELSDDDAKALYQWLLDNTQTP